MEFVHPKVTLLTTRKYTEPRILPVYPLSDSIKQSQVRRLVAETTERLAGDLVEVMPDHLRQDQRGSCGNVVWICRVIWQVLMWL